MITHPYIHAAGPELLAVLKELLRNPRPADNLPAEEYSVRWNAYSDAWDTAQDLVDRLAKIPRISEMEHLIHYAFAHGCCVVVPHDDGVTGFGDATRAINRLRDFDDIRFTIRQGKKSIAWVHFVNGNRLDEEVADYSDNAWMARWANVYAVANGLPIVNTPKQIEALEQAEASCPPKELL